MMLDFTLLSEERAFSFAFKEEQQNMTVIPYVPIAIVCSWYQSVTITINPHTAMVQNTAAANKLPPEIDKHLTNISI